MYTFVPPNPSDYGSITALFFYDGHTRIGNNNNNNNNRHLTIGSAATYPNAAAAAAGREGGGESCGKMTPFSAGSFAC